MKAKIGRGDGFRGALNYALDEGHDRTGAKNPEIVGGNLTATTADSAASEFGLTRRLRPDAKSPVWHCSLALPAGDRLDSDKWREVSSDFMQRMGWPPDTLYIVIRHSDTDYDHVHVIASRISLSGTLWHGHHDVYKAIEATQDLERIHGMTLTPGLGDAKAEKKLSKAEIEMALRTGEEPPRQRLQRLIDAAVKDKPTAPELAGRLQAAGVGVRANIASTGKMSGFSFEINGIWFKGGDLGRAYTWGGLQKRGVTYEQNGDRTGLERFRPTVADRGKRHGVAAVGEPDAQGFEAATGGDFDRNGGGVGAVGASPTRSVNGAGDSAPDIGRIDSGNGGEGGCNIRAEGRGAGLDHLQPISHPVGDGKERHLHGENRPAGGGHTGGTDNRSEAFDAGIGRTTTQSETSSVASDVWPDSGWSRGRSGSRYWSSGFCVAGATKFRPAECDMGGSSVEQGYSERASTTAPDSQATLALVQWNIESYDLAGPDYEYEQTREVADEEEEPIAQSPCPGV